MTSNNREPESVDEEHHRENHDSALSVEISRRKFLATSAVGVASLGVAGPAAAAPEEHDLYVQGLGPETTYSFTVGGDLEKSAGGKSASINDNDDIVGQSAHGVVSTGDDAYTFTGPLYSFDYDRSGGIQVSLDAHSARVGERPDNLLVIEGVGPNTSYSFTAGENLKHSDAYDATADAADSITHRSAHGAVSNGTDAYTFDGDLESFSFDQSGALNVSLNGKPAHVGRRFDHTLLIEGFGTKTDYEFVIPGGGGQSSAYGASVDLNDNVVVGRGSGTITGGKDAYAFNGELKAFSFDQDGEIRVTVDGKPAHVGNLPDHTLSFKSTGGYGRYSASVSGSIYAIDNIENHDTVRGASVSGAVSSGRDNYGFSGELTDLSLDGEHSPEALFDGEVVEPSDY